MFSDMKGNARLRRARAARLGKGRREEVVSPQVFWGEANLGVFQSNRLAVFFSLSCFSMVFSSFFYFLKAVEDDVCEFFVVPGLFFLTQRVTSLLSSGIPERFDLLGKAGQ